MERVPTPDKSQCSHKITFRSNEDVTLIIFNAKYQPDAFCPCKTNHFTTHSKQCRRCKIFNCFSFFDHCCIQFSIQEVARVQQQSNKNFVSWTCNLNNSWNESLVLIKLDRIYFERLISGMGMKFILLVESEAYQKHNKCLINLKFYDRRRLEEIACLNLEMFRVL